MLFSKGDCNFGTCKDSVCLLSNLVEHVLIAYGPLGNILTLKTFTENVWMLRGISV